jgi:ribonucleotide monophosphatase NagD (HAD superfamily)
VDSVKYAGIILDLDGTVYRGDELITGVAEFFAGYVDKIDLKVLFYTNRSSRTPLAIANKLNAMGLSVREEQLLTSSLSASRNALPGLPRCKWRLASNRSFWANHIRRGYTWQPGKWGWNWTKS